MWLPFFWQAGGEILKDGNTFDFDTDAAIKATEFYTSFMADGIAPKVATDDEKFQNFVDGKLGSFVSGPWDIANVMTVAAEDSFKDKFAVAVLPAGEKPASFIGGSNLAVFKDAKNPEGAWKFIKFLSEPANQLQWYKISSDLPSTEEGWNDPSLADDSKLAVFGEALKTAKAVPAIPTWAEASAQIDRVLEAAVSGKIAATETGKQIQEAVEAVGTK
jgi:multiple sugar transport system substrate-binding protein